MDETYLVSFVLFLVPESCDGESMYTILNDLGYLKFKNMHQKYLAAIADSLIIIM